MSSKRPLWNTRSSTIDVRRTDDTGARQATAPTPVSASGPRNNPVRAVRDPLVGSLLHARYRVERRIGKGGMGVVYLAEHVLIRRKVAIKVLHAPAFDSEEKAERFQREAMAAAAVGSDHVVGVTDMGQLENGSFYLVLEYLDGIELAAAVTAEGYLPVARAIDIATQLCDALTMVHAAGIVHRDLKPENLFLIERAGRSDFLKILDFGICKVHDDQGDARRLTASGTALGTPQFMAPEQVEGRADIDHRADIYAVGGILFVMLAGVDPFDAPSLPRLFMTICESPPPPLCTLRPDVPEALAAVVARALAKRPEDRFQTSAELKAALAPFANSDAASSEALASGAAAIAPPRTSAPAITGGSDPLRVPGHRVWPRRLAIALTALATIGVFWRMLELDGVSRSHRATGPTSSARRARTSAKPHPVIDSAQNSSHPSMQPSVSPQAEAASVAARPAAPLTSTSRSRAEVRNKPRSVAATSSQTAEASLTKATPQDPSPAAEAPSRPASNAAPPPIAEEPWPAQRTLKHVF
jgi:serine/threonine protein kinase